MDFAPLLVGLIRGLGLVALVVLAYSWFLRFFDGTPAKGPLIGVLFSAGGVLSMSDPISLAPGIIVDGRVPILALAFPYAGPVGALIVTVILCICRVWVGGIGMLPGILGILLCTALSVAVYRISRRRIRSRLLRVLLLGLAAAGSIVTLYSLPNSVAAHLGVESLLTVVVFNTLSVVLLDNFLHREKQRYTFMRTLETNAATDPLTSLNNRRAFEEAASRVLDRDPRGSVIMIDVDHFKSINDTFGHLTGDKVLKDVASIVSGAVRKTDIVARYGGEEIIVLVPGSDMDDVERVAEKIRLQIAGHVFDDALDIRVTVSAGTASSNSTVRDLGVMTRAADEALYRAKKKGRNRVEAAVFA